MVELLVFWNHTCITLTQVCLNQFFFTSHMNGYGHRIAYIMQFLGIDRGEKGNQTEGASSSGGWGFGGWRNLWRNQQTNQEEQKQGNAPHNLLVS